MNKNEIRGYIFMGFALLCFCTDCIVPYRNFTLFSFQVILVIASIVCFGLAYVESKDKEAFPIPVEQNRVINRIGQIWAEYNLFSVKVGKLDARASKEGEMLSCVMHITAENWQPQLKNKENNLTIRMSAVGEAGKENIELPLSEAFEIMLEAGASETQLYPFDVPANLDRVLLEFTAEADSSDEVYTQTYEIYPKHYVR